MLMIFTCKLKDSTDWQLFFLSFNTKVEKWKNKNKNTKVEVELMGWGNLLYLLVGPWTDEFHLGSWDG